MFDEDDLLPVSGLCQVAYCERRWALMFLEEQWAENRFTVAGAHMHERVHGDETEVRGDVRIARSLRLRSLRLGLTGMADVIEFHRLPDGTDSRAGPDGLREGMSLAGVPGLWRPYPVEYKLGKPKLDRSDEVQVCGQVLCLEEMLGVRIPDGALFYGRPRRRYEVSFDTALRVETEALAARMHALFAVHVTPTAAYEKKCDNCSLFELCLPKTTGARHSAEKYLSRSIKEAQSDREEG